MKSLIRTKLIGGTLVLAGAMLTNTAPVMAQDYGNAGNYNYAPAGQFDNLVSRIALYPDPLLAQIFAAAAFPDQIAAAAQGSGGPFDPSVEALMQYPSVLQMMASDPSWTQALGQAVIDNQGAVMDAIQNLRREAQQYGYLQSGSQMQVVDDGGYIDIEPVGGYLYVPVYDPYVVFARPRPGFFVGGAIHFGGGFHWAGGFNSFNWRSHEVVVNRRVWTAPVRTINNQPQRFDNNRRTFTAGNRDWNRTAPAPQAPVQRNFTPAPQPPLQRNYAPAPRPTEQRSFTPAPRPTEQRNFAPAPRQMEQHSFTPPARNEGGHVERGNEGHGRGR
jgi:hypothetical protein